MTNWDRQYRLSAGPAGGTGFEIGETSPQQPTAMHINFSLSKNDSSTSNTGKVTVWNLSDAHIAVLNEKDCCVQLKAGYGKTMGLIFSGLVSFVCTEKDGADQKTTIEVTDSTVGIRDTYVSVSYADKINARPILDDIAAQMGLVPSYSYDAQFSDIQNGFSFVGLARDAKKGSDFFQQFYRSAVGRLGCGIFPEPVHQRGRLSSTGKPLCDRIFPCQYNSDFR